jgi:hypothetical protein
MHGIEQRMTGPDILHTSHFSTGCRTSREGDEDGSAISRVPGRAERLA